MTTLARPTLDPPPTPQRLARFWAKVDKDGPVHPELGPCWQWTGKLTVRTVRGSGGYGAFWNGERELRAHRFVYELLVEPIPAELVIDHLCRNRGCVNPDHLEVVTNGENCRRGDGVGANARKAYCPKGHSYDEKNTIWRLRPDGRGVFRRCRQCAREGAKAHRARAKVAA